MLYSSRLVADRRQITGIAIHRCSNAIRNRMKGGDRGGLDRTDFEEVIGRGVVAELILGAVFFSGCWLSRYDSSM